jgi:hypothetical protein
VDFLIPIVAIFFVIGVPVLAVATHFVLRPLVRDIITAINGKGVERLEEFDARLHRLEESLFEQNEQLERLLEAEAFRLRLEGGSEGSGERAGRSSVDDDRAG